MPWSSQNGGGGWISGGGGPWGPSGGGQSPDLDEFLKRGQDRLKQAIPGGGMSGGLLALIALVAIGMIGFFGFTFRVNPDEKGVVLRFGELVREVPQGLHFRFPYPVEEVYLPKVTRTRRTEIGLREGAASRGFAAPTRDVPEESLMLTGDENIVDVDFVVFWEIKDAAKFLFAIQNPEVAVKAVAESAMREVVGKGQIQRILTEDRAETELAVKDLIQTTLDEYGAGINITQVQMQQVDPPNQVIGAFRDVQAAKADQERIRNEAEAYANKVVPESRGEAERILQAAKGYEEQTIAEAVGQADRFLKVYGEYKKAPVVTRKRMFLETMERVFSEMDKVIIDNSGGGQGVVPYLPLSELTKRGAAGGAQR